MKTTENSLDIFQIGEILPQKYKPLQKIKGRLNIYETKGGTLVGFKRSKNYGDSVWWCSVYIYRFKNKNVTNVCFIIGFQGVIIVPIELLLKYAEYANSNKYVEDRFFVRIKKQSNDFVLYQSGHEDINITQYYIPNEQDDSFIDEMSNESLESIYNEAQKFSDYENQYYYVTKEVKQRHESKKQKERIAILENHTCQICGFQQSYINNEGKKRWIIEVDHIIGKAQGGGENIDNMLVLCPNCHAKKTYGIIEIDENYNVYENGNKIEISNHHIKMRPI